MIQPLFTDEIIMVIYLPIDDFSIALESSSDLVIERWKRLFGERLCDTLPYPVMMRLVVELADRLPPLPKFPPFFQDHRIFYPDLQAGFINAYQLENGQLLLYFPGGGEVTLPKNDRDSAEPPVAYGVIVQQLLDGELLDDFTTISISPTMRHHGYYMIHSSGVSLNGKGILFIGESRSGKTTTCLNLVLHGWSLLANDVIILRRQRDRFYVYPLPDLITIRPNTLKLLPELSQLLEQQTTYSRISNEIYLSTDKLFPNQQSAPSELVAICFPEVMQQSENTLSPLPQAVTLARLLETSLDCWDLESISDHATLLTELAQQLPAYRLSLGQLVHTLPDSIAPLINDLL